MADIKYGIELDVVKDRAIASLRSVEGAAKKSASKVTNTFRTMGRKIGGGLKSLIGSRLGVVALGAAVAKLGADFAKFESKMIDVGNLMGANRKEVKALSAEVKTLSARYGVGAQGLANSLFDVISAGVPAARAIGFLEEATKLAKAGVTDTKTAVDGLTSVINAYGLEASNAADISDLFFAAQVKGKTTIAELSSTIGRLAPISKAAGLSLEDMFASVATLTAGGIKTDEAITSMRATLTSIIKPSKEAQEVAQALGIDFSATALRSKGLVNFLADVQEKTNGNVEVITKLIPNVRALQGVLALAGEQADAFAENQAALAERAGATQEAFEQQANTTAHKWGVMVETLKQLGLDLFDALAPVLNGLLVILQKVTGFLTGSMFAEGSQKIDRQTEAIRAQNDAIQEQTIAFARATLKGEALRKFEEELAKTTGKVTKKQKELNTEISTERTKAQKERQKKIEELLKKLATTGGGGGGDDDGKTPAEIAAEKSREAMKQEIADRKQQLAELSMLRDVELQDEIETMEAILENKKIIGAERQRIETDLATLKGELREQEERAELEKEQRIADEKERLAEQQKAQQERVNSAIEQSFASTFQSNLKATQDFFGSFREAAKSALLTYFEGKLQQVLVDTASGLMTAVSTKNPTMFAQVTAQSAASLAQIAASMGVVKGLATGGITTGETIARIGEQNKREAVIPLESPQGRRALDQVAGGDGGNMNQNVTLEIDGIKLANIMTNKQAQGRRQGRF
jgi:TP901 family phage tail tape measure protein